MVEKVSQDSMTPEERLKIVRQIGFSALSAIDRGRSDVIDGRSDLALAAIARANAEHLGDPEITAVLAGGLPRYEKLVSLAQRAADLGAEIEGPLLPAGWSCMETIAGRHYRFGGGHVEVSVAKEVDRDCMRIKVYGFNTWTGYEGDRGGHVPLLEALRRAEETFVDPSSHLSEYGVNKVAEAKDIVEKNREELIAAMGVDAQAWQATADRYKNVLLGERYIVLDKHERAFSQIYENGEPAIKLELPSASLTGVSFMTAENANKVRTDLEGRWPDLAPYVAVDFQEYAQSKANESTKLAKQLVDVKWSADREALTLDDAKELAGVVIEQLGYTVPAWRKTESSLSPWEYVDVEVGGRDTLLVGASSGGVVAINGDPFTPGERKTNVIRERVVESFQAGVDFLRRGLGNETPDLSDVAAVALDKERRVVVMLNEDQKVWVETLMRETGIGRDHALSVNDVVGDLAAKHFKLTLMNVEDGLTSPQEAAQEAIEAKIREAVEGLPGIKDADFIYDPRGTTVGVRFESGASDSFTGMWKVPLAAGAVKALDSDFWETYVPTGGEVALEFALKEANPDAAALHENISELVRLSTMHTKLAAMVSEDMNLSYDDEFGGVKEGVREAIRDQINNIAGISDVEFTMDSRFSTVVIQLENGRSNRMSGGWGVPVDDALLDGLDYGDDIASVYGDDESPDKNTDNTALEALCANALAVAKEHGHTEVGKCFSDDLADFSNKTSIQKQSFIDDLETYIAHPDWAYTSKDGKRTQESGFVVLSITETGNAAFVDVGRDHEIARIVEEAASKIAADDSVDDTNFFLRDTNGNKVGKVEHTTTVPTGDPEEGTVRLSVELGNAAFEDGPAGEVARILREAAAKVLDGEHIFAMRDYNGNLVGKFEFREPPSLEKDGVVNMTEALNTGRVYMEDGIADGEYRFVVTAGDFEPGYGQGEGEVWLVNAKGEVASGYEEPQSVREVMFRELKRDEKSDLLAVVEGRIEFDDYERRFSDDDPALG